MRGLVRLLIKYLISYFVLHTHFLALRTPLIETLLAVCLLSLNILPAAATKNAFRKLMNAALQSDEIYPRFTNRNGELRE